MAELERIGIIGDIHAEDVLLEGVLEHFVALGLERIFAVGDIVDGKGDVNRCCALLAQHQVETVCGNHDRWFLAGEMRQVEDATLSVSPETRTFLESLPKTIEISTAMGHAILGHGVGDDDMSFLREDTRGYDLQGIVALRTLMEREELRFVIGGHTHHAMVRHFKRLSVVNAGTLHRQHRPTATWLDFGRAEAHFIPLACEPSFSMEPDILVSLLR